MDSLSCLIKARWKKEDLTKDLICGMKKRVKAESKVKAKLWMVEEGASERLGGILIE